MGGIKSQGATEIPQILAKHQYISFSTNNRLAGIAAKGILKGKTKYLTHVLEVGSTCRIAPQQMPVSKVTAV